MADDPNDATPFLPKRRSLKALREAAFAEDLPAVVAVLGAGERQH